MSNKTYKLFADKMGGRPASEFVGQPGEIFYDPDSTSLRISDGVTPGGVVLSSGGGDTGDVTFSGIQVIGGGTGSGDGYGNGTLELVPDVNLYGAGQYIVVDPTVPSHIHLRAGGEQDQSPAELFLGGERNHVKVNDNDGVTLQNVRAFESAPFFNENTEYTSGSWLTDGGTNFVEFTSTDALMIQSFWDFGNDSRNQLIVYYNNGNDVFTLTYGGSASSLGGNVYRVAVVEAPTTSPIALSGIEFRLFRDGISVARVTDGDFYVEVDDDINMYSKNVFRLVNYSANDGIEVTTDYDDQSYNWSFRPNGMLDFPQGGTFGVKDSVPTTSVGVSGDRLGMIALDASYLYYCTANYDGVANIWKRVAWSNDTW